MSTRKIFLVVESSGDYEEYREHIICAFDSPKDAELYARCAAEWLAQAVAHWDGLDLHWDDSSRWKKRHPSPFDEGWERDSSYRVDEIAIREGVPSETFSPKPFRRTPEP